MLNEFTINQSDFVFKLPNQDREEPDLDEMLLESSAQPKHESQI